MSQDIQHDSSQVFGCFAHLGAQTALELLRVLRRDLLVHGAEVPRLHLRAHPRDALLVEVLLELRHARRALLRRLAPANPALISMAATPSPLDAPLFPSDGAKVTFVQRH